MESAGSGGVGGLGGEEEAAAEPEAILSSKKQRKATKRSKSLHALAKRLEMPVCLDFFALMFEHVDSLRQCFCYFVFALVASDCELNARGVWELSP